MIDRKQAFEPLQQPLEYASHAPGFIYTAQEVLDREIDEYFMKDWLFAGRIEEIPNPGDYLSVRVLDESVVIIRASDMSIGAYYNQCLHRGVEIAQGNGNARSFKCPYHGWVYDLKGNLKGAPRMDGVANFEKSKCRLREVRFGEWRGNMFISFASEGKSLDEHIEHFEKDFGFLQMDKCRLGNTVVMEINCNWKMVHENVMDFYHVPVLHSRTIGDNFQWENDDVILKDNGGVTIWYKNRPQTPDGATLFKKMPWLEDRDHSFSCHGFCPPNFSFFGRIDHVRTLIVWPLGPDRCQIISHHLFPEEVFDLPDVQERLKIYHDYQKVILSEDITMIESMQRAMKSRGYIPGRMSNLEKPLHHYLNGYARRIFHIQSEEK